VDCRDEVAAAFERLKTSGRPYRKETSSLISDQYQLTSHETAEFLPPDRIREITCYGVLAYGNHETIRVGQRGWLNEEVWPWGWREWDPRPADDLLARLQTIAADDVPARTRMLFAAAGRDSTSVRLLPLLDRPVLPGDVFERESREALDAIKAEVGSLLFSAQYQQRPVPLEGNLIRRSWFRAYDNLPASPSQTKIVQSWDVAMMTGGQNDYSVCTTWFTHNNDAYLLHVYRCRLEYPELRRKVISLAAEHRAITVLIEDAGPGMNLLQDLRTGMPRGMTRPVGVKPEGSKVDRMAAQSAKIEAGHVHLPNCAPWLGEFLTELLSFPNGRHDDQVDSVSQFLRWRQNDAYQNPLLCAPILFTRADMGLPPLLIDWSCRY
jgi:predicted phage terminase large subunit-like protein